MKHLTLFLGSLLVLLAVSRWPNEPRSVKSSPRLLASTAEKLSAVPPPIAPSSEPAMLRECSDLLEQARTRLISTPAYTATFRKQERVGDTLRDLETIDLKLRHQPFSVAMHWTDNGRTVHYCDGSNGNRLMVRMGGWKRRLGWIHLDPDSRLAMQESRYPVTDVGLLRLTEQLLEHFAPYNDRVDGVRCEWRADEQIGGRPCRVFLVEYASPDVFRDYRKTIVWLDHETSAPLAVQSYDWHLNDAGNPEGLVEYYAYEDVKFDCPLEDADFQVAGESTSSNVASANTLD